MKYLHRCRLYCSNFGLLAVVELDNYDNLHNVHLYNYCKYRSLLISSREIPELCGHYLRYATFMGCFIICTPPPNYISAMAALVLDFSVVTHLYIVDPKVICIVRGRGVLVVALSKPGNFEWFTMRGCEDALFMDR
jgi:hypothetical protein